MFIEFCQILVMKLNFSIEITSMNINDKSIASLQTVVSPRRNN